MKLPKAGLKNIIIQETDKAPPRNDRELKRSVNNYEKQSIT